MRNPSAIISIVAMLAIAMAPTATAADQWDAWYYTVDPFEGTGSAHIDYQLSREAPERRPLVDELLKPHNDSKLELIPQVSHVWALPPLTLAADVSGQAAGFDLYFTDAVGQITWTYGFVDATGFVALGQMQKTVDPVGALGVQSTTPLGGTLNGGRALGEFVLDAGSIIPAGASPAIMIESTVPNGLFLKQSGAMGQGGASQSSIPLPEFPAWGLLGVGLVAVVAAARFRKNPPQ